MDISNTTKDLLKIACVVLLFVLAMSLTKVYQDEIVNYLDFGYIGMLFYVTLGIIATVLAPISTLPLIPVAVSLWGSFITALLCIIAWSTGAVIAFLLARRFGQPILKRYVDLNTIYKYEKILGTKYIFWQIIALRIMIPVDILSYAIGLFSSVNLTTYTLATIIGITPFAFVFSYMPTLNIWSQVAVAIFVGAVAYFGYRKIHGGLNHQ